MEESENFPEFEPQVIRCDRCSNVIHVGDRYFSLNFTLEDMTGEFDIGILAHHVLNRLCLGCGSVMLVEDITGRNMMQPASQMDILKNLKRRNKKDQFSA
jgi:hypothetical protein